MTEDKSGRDARSYAMTLLSRRAYTEKGLYDKIEARYGEKWAAAAVERMLELGLLDDGDYARRHADGLSKIKGFAPRRVALELKRKGIDADVAEAAVQELDIDQEAAIARIILRKYLPFREKYFEDEKGRGKMINALLRLGYVYGDVAAALRNIERDETYYDDLERE